jgi:hypothetical protein
MRFGICASVATWSTSTLRIALWGMLGKTASAGSCTIASPPCRLISDNPDVPSSSPPDRIRPITRGPYAIAAVRNSGSTAGRNPFSFGPRVTRARPDLIST